MDAKSSLVSCWLVFKGILCVRGLIISLQELHRQSFNDMVPIVRGDAGAVSVPLAGQGWKQSSHTSVKLCTH